MKIKHYYFFDEKDSDKKQFEELNASNWDILRTNKRGGSFAVEREISDYERNCNSCLEYKEAAKIICKLLNDYGLKRRIVSLGCGKGIIEWHIKKLMPELYVKCTDYTSESLKLLEKVFIACDEFGIFDMLEKDDYKKLEQDDIMLMYRVSTEFSIYQWKAIFDKLHQRGIEYIVFVPAEILTLQIAINEKKVQFCNWLKHRKNTFSGWMYSKNEYVKIFAGTDNKSKYEIAYCEKLGNTEIMLLQRKG